MMNTKFKEILRKRYKSYQENVLLKSLGKGTKTYEEWLEYSVYAANMETQEIKQALKEISHIIGNFI